MIRSKLREPESSQQEEALFSDTGIFGSFRQKIWTAYFLKWIGPLTRRDLDLVRSIRNIVAHNMNPVSFDTPEIANRCSELFVAKNSVPAQQRPTDLRGMLMLGVKFYTGALLLKTLEHKQDVVDLEVVKYLEGNSLGPKAGAEVVDPIIRSTWPFCQRERGAVGRSRMPMAWTLRECAA